MRSRPGVPAAALLAVVLVLAGLLPAGPSAGAPALPVAQDGTGAMAIVAQTPFVAPEGAFDLRLDVSGAPPEAELRWTIHAAVGSRSAFQQTVTGGPLGSIVTRSEAQPLSAVAQGGEVRLFAPLTAGSPEGDQVGLRAEGVHPVSVELLDADGETIDSLVTHLVRLPAPDDERRDLAVAVVLSLHAPLATGVDGALGLDPSTVEQLADVADVLARHPGVPVTVVPTPETLDALGADPTGVEALDDLLSPSGAGSVLAGPYVRLDLDAWVAAGLAGPGGALDRQLAAGADVLAARLPGAAVDDDVAVLPAPVTGGTLGALTERGRTTFVVAEEVLAPLDGDDFPVTLTRPFLARAADGGPAVTAVATDAALGSHLGATTTGDPALDAARTLADIAVLAGDEPVLRRGAVLALPDAVDVDPAALEALLAGLSQAGAVPADDVAPPGAPPPTVTAPIEPTTVGELVATVEPAGAEGGAADGDVLVRALPPVDAAELGAFPARLAEVRTDVQSLVLALPGLDAARPPDDDDADAPTTTAAPTPDPAIDATPPGGRGPSTSAALDRRLLAAGAEELSAPERRRRLDAVAGDVRSALQGVTLPPPQVLTLTAREGTVQVTLGNSTGEPVRVRLELRADRLEFPDQPDGALEVTLAEPTTRVDLDVRALGSGDARLGLRLTTPDGRIPLADSRVTVRATALSGIGVALSVAAVAVLLVWWIRSIRRERRERRGGGLRRKHARA